MPENAQDTAEAINTVDQRMRTDEKMLIASLIMFVLSCIFLAFNVYKAGGVEPAMDNVHRYFEHIKQGDEPQKISSTAQMDH